MLRFLISLTTQLYVESLSNYNEIIKALHYWSFVLGIHWLPVDSLHKGPAMPLIIGGFPAQRVNIAESVFMSWWPHTLVILPLMIQDQVSLTFEDPVLSICQSFLHKHQWKLAYNFCITVLTFKWLFLWSLVWLNFHLKYQFFVFFNWSRKISWCHIPWSLRLHRNNNDDNAKYRQIFVSLESEFEQFVPYQQGGNIDGLVQERCNSNGVTSFLH